MLCSRPGCDNEFELKSNHSTKKYCSQSCAAKVSNVNRAQPKGNCLYCSTILNSKSKKYCNSDCQQAYQQHVLIGQWLTSGKATTGSNPGHYIRVYISAEQSGKCDICKTDRVWNGKELRFVLDHIDGNSENNCRDNLRLVCPNCDSQLDTYKSKNKGNGRYSRRIRYANSQSY